MLKIALAIAFTFTLGALVVPAAGARAEGDTTEAQSVLVGTVDGVDLYARTLRVGRHTIRVPARVPGLRTLRLGSAVAVEYEVEDVLGGAYSEAWIRVSHRVLANGEVLPVSRRATSESYELVATSFFDNPQVESLYLSNTLPKRSGAPLFFSSAID